MNYLQNLGPSAGRNGGPMTVFPVRDSILMSINRKTFAFPSSIDYNRLDDPLFHRLFVTFSNVLHVHIHIQFSFLVIKIRF